MEPEIIKEEIQILESKDKEGKEWDVCLIEAGLSKNGKLYPKEVLQNSVNLFDGVKAFCFELGRNMFNHLPIKVQEMIPQGLVKNIVGWYEKPRFDSFRDSEGNLKWGVLARLHISENAKWLSQLLKDAWEHGKKSLLGLSIDGAGITVKEDYQGRMIDRVTDLLKINSVDIVTQPSAGGQLIRLLASINSPEEVNMNWKDLLDFVSKHDAKLIEGIDPENIMQEQAITLLNKVVEIQEDEKQFEEALGFYSSIIDQVIGLIDSDKKDEAMKVLGLLKAKLDKYGYAYPVAGQGNGGYQYPYAQKYGYPYTEESYGPPMGYGKYGYMQKKKKKVVVKQEVKPQEGITMTPEELKRLEEAEGKLKKLDEIDNSLKIKESEVSLKESLIDSKLPVPVRDHMMKEYKGRIMSKEEIDGAIKSQKDLLAAVLQETNQVQGCGRVEVTLDEKDKLQKAMDGFFFDKDIDNVPRFKSFRQAFRKVTGLHEASAVEMLSESVGFIPKEYQHMKITESLQTSSWGQILGDSVTRRMIAEYTLPELQSWRKIVSEIIPVSDFRTQRRMLLGGYGVLPAVSETGSYQALSSPTDDEMTYAVGKKGGTEDLTMEMIKNDDVGSIKRIPKKLGRAAAQTLYRAIFDMIVNNTVTMWDGKVLFHTDHGNLGDQELSASYLSEIKQLMMDQVAYGDAYEVLGMTNIPKFILAPSELEELCFKLKTSKTLIGATNNAGTEPNIHATQGLDYIILPYWTDSKDFAVVADPNAQPTIEVGFLDGKEEPELFVQDMPNVGSVFTADKITYKIRHIFGTAPLDYRTMFKSVVA
jgi:hypothetical protein